MLSQGMERRVDDIWKRHVDDHINLVSKMLEVNTKVTQETSEKLDTHIETTRQLQVKVAPVIEAMETMKGGIRVIGWIGSKATALIIIASSLLGIILGWRQWK